MLRSFVALFIWFASTFAGLAGDSDLVRLDTGDHGRDWEAVGRLDIDGRGFCTGALIAPDLVLTAAHCLYDKFSGDRFEVSDIEFKAGLRNGRAAAYRGIRRVAVHPDYVFEENPSPDRVGIDVALLELQLPIRNTTVFPFGTAPMAAARHGISIVSYALDRAEAPSRQERCRMLGQSEGVFVMSCAVDFGASGAPVFTVVNGEPRIVSVVSAKAFLNGEPVALGMDLEGPLHLLQAHLTKGTPLGATASTPSALAVRNQTGAKFVRAEGG